MGTDIADVLERGRLIDGRYRLERVAGQGAFGVVYEAHHIALDTRVAIKVLRVVDESPARAGAVAQFLSEARTLVALRHPAIVRVLDAGVIDGNPYFVMEWCDGPTLKSFIDERGPRTVTEAWTLLEPVFEAIAFSHRKGIAHRDIKPSNIVLFEGSARVIDFGIAKLITPDDAPGAGDTTTHGQSPFTPKYASPEQLAGARTGPWTDVYALALLFTEVLGSRDLGSLEPVLSRALARRPADRFADAGELTKAVREALVPRRRLWWSLSLIPAVAAGLVIAYVARPRVVEDRGRADAAAEPVPSGSSTAELASAVPTSLATPVASKSASPAASVGATRTPSTAVVAEPKAATTTWAFEVNGYENGGFIGSNGIQAVSRAAQGTKPCFPEPKADELWNVYIVFLWPKGRTRESRIEVKRNADRVLTDLGNGQRIGEPNAVAEQIASCVRGKFDGASIPDADGQDDLPSKTAYDKIDMGYFRK